MSGLLFFFDVPIYRLPEDEYYAQRESYIHRAMYGCTPTEEQTRRDMYLKYPDLELNSRDAKGQYYGGPWNFNEIIGYIPLYFLGSQIRGELWMVERKRIVRTRKKLILFRSHKVASELEVPYTLSNQDIFRLILKYLDRAKKELKGRFIDTSGFEQIGKFVDWNALRKDM